MLISNKKSSATQPIKSEPGKPKKFKKPKPVNSGISESKKEKLPQKDRKRKYENFGSDRPDWKRLRVESKEIKEHRKRREMNNDCYEAVTQAKNIWETVRCKSLSKDKRMQSCAELFDLIKPYIKKLSFAHDTARILQTVLRYGSEEARATVFKEFSTRPTFMELVNSKYGHFLAVKLFKYLNVEQRNHLFGLLKPGFRSHLKHTYASVVLDDFFQKHAKESQKNLIIRDCYSPIVSAQTTERDDIALSHILERHPEMKKSILSDVKETVETCFRKKLTKYALFHCILSNYLTFCDPQERTDIISELREEAYKYANTKYGSSLVTELLRHGTPKDRKVIIKTLKGQICELARNQHGHFVLLSIIDVTDDVVLVSKAVCADLMNNINEIVMDEYGRRTLSYLLEHRSPLFFDPKLKSLLSSGDSNQFTKKPVEVRVKDISQPLKDKFLNAVRDNAGMWISENSACLMMLLIFKRYATPESSSDPEDFQEALTSLASYLVDLPTADGIERRAVEMLTKFLLCDNSIPIEIKKLFAEPLVNDLIEKSKLKDWVLTNRSCFTLIRIFEQCGEDNTTVQSLKSALKKHKQLLKKNTTAGGKLLMQIVSK